MIVGSSRRLLACAIAAAIAVGGARGASAWTAAAGAAERGAIEARFRALAAAPKRDRQALAELDARARRLADEAARALGAMREAAAERDEDMAAVVQSAEWRDTENLLLELRFRIAAIELERALAGDPERTSLARAAAESFGSFVEAPDAELAAEARYGRGLARIAAGEREAGLEDLRAAATVASVAPRARIALAEALADGGQNANAMALVTRQLDAGGLSRDLELRAKLLRLKLLVGAGRGGDAKTSPAGPAALVADLSAAGEPWRGAALAVVAGREDLLPSGPDADAASLRLRAEAAVRRGDETAAVEAWRALVARDEGRADGAAQEGLARAALATGSFSEARGAVAAARALGRPWNRDLALIDLRASYGLWRVDPGPGTAEALSAAAAAVSAVHGRSADDAGEAAFHRAEVARGAGDLEAAIDGFSAIDAPEWALPGRIAALQTRALRLARAPGSEPREALLRDLEALLAQPGLPADARASVIVLDATLRAEGTPGEAEVAGGRAALARLMEVPRLGPAAASAVPAALRARADLEVAIGEKPDPAMLELVPAGSRAALAAEIAADLRDRVAAAAPAAEPATRERARAALAAALEFAALAPAGERSVGRLALAEQALTIGESATAASLFRAENEANPRSLSALRGLARASRASGDAAASRAAWERLAAIPDLPPALRAEAEAALAGAALTPRPPSP